MRKVFGFLAGVLLGGLLGGMAALLFAPRSGDDIQSEVRERINLIIQEGRRAAAERRAELEAQFAEAKRSGRQG